MTKEEIPNIEENEDILINNILSSFSRKDQKWGFHGIFPSFFDIPEKFKKDIGFIKKLISATPEDRKVSMFQTVIEANGYESHGSNNDGMLLNLRKMPQEDQDFLKGLFSLPEVVELYDEIYGTDFDGSRVIFCKHYFGLLSTQDEINPFRKIEPQG